MATGASAVAQAESPAPDGTATPAAVSAPPATDDGVPDRTPGTPVAARPHRWTAGGERPRWGWADAALCLLLVAVACTITVLGVVRATTLSPYDEASHIDYTWSIAQGELPAAGSTMAPEVLREWSCRSQQQASAILPPCGTEPVPAEYPMRGENYNYWHTPGYYAVTAAVASALDALPVGTTFVTSARLTGALWLSAGLVATYLVLRVWRTSRLIAVSAAALLAAVPTVAHASSIVTNDAPAVLVGAAALWLLARVFLQGRTGWVLPTVLAVAVAATKMVLSIAVLAVAGVVLLAAVDAARRRDGVRARRLWAVGAGITGGVAAVYLAWGSFQSGRGDPDWSNPVEGINTAPVEGSPVDEWLPTLLSAFGVVDTFFLQTPLTSIAVVTSVRLLSLLFAAAPFVTVAAFDRGDPRRSVGWAALAGCAAVPLLVQVQAYLMFEDYFPNPSTRYGLALLPLLVGGLALVAHARRWRVVPVAVAGLCLAALLLSFAGAFTPTG